MPVSVTFEVDAGSELWRRDFSGHRFRSRQWQGSGRSEWLLCERFGAVTVSLALVADEGRLSLVPRRGTVFGIPLPRLLLPGGHAFEFEEAGRFRFDVEIAHPWTGPIVRYRGWLDPRHGIGQGGADGQSLARPAAPAGVSA